MWRDDNLLKLDRQDQLTMYTGLQLCQKFAHTIATNAGWYTDPETGEEIRERNFGEVVALMHSELSEALEAHRKGKEFDDKLTDKDAVAVELADCIIRILDTASALNLNIADAYLCKCIYNTHRSDHKLENRAKKGGKKY